MKRGISSFFGYDLPLAERARLIAQAGFTHTNLWWGPPELLYAQGRLDDTPSMIRGAGLAISYMHVPFEASNELWSPMASDRSRFVDRHLRWLADGNRHGVGCMVLHTSYGPTSPGPNLQGIRAFQRVVEEAGQAGVSLALENTRRDDILHHLLAMYDQPWVGLCYDSAHDWLWGRPELGSLSRWSGRLMQTHLCDAGVGTDRHRLPGDGELDWEAIAAAFPREYQGPLTLEVLPADLSPYDGPEAFLTEAMRRWEALAMKLGYGRRGATAHS